MVTWDVKLIYGYGFVILKYVCTHGDHPFLLYTWGPSICIPIVHMGTIHPYCTHGDHPSLLYTWRPSIPIVHMGAIHPYCTHRDLPSLLYTWGPSIPIVPVPMWKWWGLYCHILSLPLLSPLTHHLLMSSVWL